MRYNRNWSRRDQGDAKLTACLSDWPMERPRDWLTRVNRPKAASAEGKAERLLKDSQPPFLFPRLRRDHDVLIVIHDITVEVTTTGALAFRPEGYCNLVGTWSWLG
jgi:hypothetical protein